MNARLLLIDNYDSFTYNLVQAFEVLGASVVGAPQRRRVGAGGARLAADAPVHFARPRHARRVRHQPRTDPRLQRADTGARRLPGPPGDRRRVRRRGRARRATDAWQDVRARALRHRPVHGPAPACAVGRYHSLVARADALPDVLTVTARAATGEIMGVRHRHHPTDGVQFHPESILTPDGPRLLANFLNGSSHVAAA